MNVISGEEQPFLTRLKSIVDANLEDEKFGVSELANEMGMSRSALYRHLKKTKNVSISRYIRQQRLYKAREMLNHPGKTVAEISYDVGFRSPAYFNHCFHVFFGYTPGKEKTHNQEIKSVKKQPIPNSKLKKRVIFWKRLVYAAAFVVIILLGWMIVYFISNR